MIFDLKYLLDKEKYIIADIIISCGGVIYDGKNLENEEILYLIILYRIYLNNEKDAILKCIDY